jgi:hypothetical protein
MASNGKNNAKNNGNSRKSGAIAYVRLWRWKTGDGATRESLPDGPRARINEITSFSALRA